MEPMNPFLTYDMAKTKQNKQYAYFIDNFFIKFIDKNFLQIVKILVIFYSSDKRRVLWYICFTSKCMYIFLLLVNLSDTTV